MKKMFCLALVVLTMLALFTGCSGRVYTDRSNNMERRSGMNGNVSTSRDGTVNGGEWYNDNSRTGTNGNNNTNSNRKHGQRMDIGAELEIGK